MHIAKQAKKATKKGRSLHSRVPHIAAKGRSAAAASTQPSQPSILISEEPFGLGFEVKILSPADGDHRGREFQDHGHAMAFARILRLEFGYPILDRSGDQS